MTINYWAVLVGAILHFSLGAVWYSPVLFGRQWLRGMGKTQEEIQAAMEEGGAKNYVISVLGSLVMAYVTAHIVNYMGQIYPGLTGWSLGAQTAFWVWLGYVATIALNHILWEGKSWGFYFITVGYQFVGLMIMGILLALWR